MRIQPIVVSGSAYQRGLSYGTQSRERIKAHLDAWLHSLVKPPISNAHTYVEQMLAETNFLPAIRTHVPDLLHEVEGIADGAGLPNSLVFALQLLDEEWTYRAALDRRPAPNKCSSLAVLSRPGLTWLAQNMDLGVYTDGHQSLLRLEADDRSTSLIFSLAGMIGLLGVNSKALGVCVNSMPQLRSSPEGLPVAFVIRKLLQCATLDEAASVLSTLPHATNQHYLLAQPGAARSFEAGPHGVVEYLPADRTRIFHTNHPLAREANMTAGHNGSFTNSQVRLRSLTDRLSRRAIGLREIQRALSSLDDPVHPVCRIKREGSGQIGFTTGSMIAALSSPPGRTRAWFTAGPPILRDYLPAQV